MKIDKINSKTCKIKNRISNYYIKAQNTIINDFLNSEFNKIDSLETLENFRHKLESFRELVGTIENYTFFDEFYSETMNKLEHKCNILENGGLETALNTKQNNPILKLLKRLFHNFKKEDSSIQ